MNYLSVKQLSEKSDKIIFDFINAYCLVDNLKINHLDLMTYENGESEILIYWRFNDNDGRKSYIVGMDTLTEMQKSNLKHFIIKKRFEQNRGGK